MRNARESGMNVVRLLFEEDCRYGLTDGETVTLISDEPFAAWEPQGVISLDGARLLPPVVPTKVVCVGLNYRPHIVEMGHEMPVEPVIFLKPSTSVVGPGERIDLPPQSARVEHEAELAVVIGRLCREVPRERVADVVLGYTCANDVTARDLQRTDGQWGRAKGFDTFCPLGPWIDTDVDPADLAVRCVVGDEVRQDGRTSQMVRDVAALVSWISDVMTLLPGDVILTGTPAGVGPLVVGDRVSVSIPPIGTLTNRVALRD